MGIIELLNGSFNRTKAWIISLKNERKIFRKVKNILRWTNVNVKTSIKIFLKYKLIFLKPHFFYLRTFLDIIETNGINF